MTMPISAALPRRTLRSRQRGMSFISVVLLGVIVVALFAIGSQSVPIFLESQAIHKAAAKAARESTVAEARAAFDRAAAIDSIESVKASDLEVTKGANGSLVVSYNYSREVHLIGPAYLVYRFQNSTAP